MANRFTDSEKWKDEWFCDLSPELKLMWLFLCDNCDHAGFWKPNQRLTDFMIGAPVDLQKTLKGLGGRVEVTKSGRWFIPKFLKFQYPSGLSETVPTTKGALKIIDSLGMRERVIELFGKGFITLKDKDKDKDKDKNKDKNKDKETSKKASAIFSFDEIYNKYPNSDGRKLALKYFKASVKTEKDFMDIKKALDNYLRSEKVSKGYIKNASTWFNNWRDWIDPRSGPIQSKIKSLDEVLK